jgi:hypothetical protein
MDYFDSLVSARARQKRFRKAAGHWRMTNCYGRGTRKKEREKDEHGVA